jgi:hypothetical protein
MWESMDALGDFADHEAAEAVLRVVLREEGLFQGLIRQQEIRRFKIGQTLTLANMTPNITHDVVKRLRQILCALQCMTIRTLPT